jgi:uncharacterized protein (DUF1697 family)
MGMHTTIQTTINSRNLCMNSQAGAWELEKELEKMMY